jgi:hypothetical protein
MRPEPAHIEDGRRRKGELRRRLLLDATVRRCAAIAEYELWLMAARRPGMRGELDRRARTLDRFASRFTRDPIDRSGITAAIDGLFLRAFSPDGPPSATEALAILERLVRRR